MTRSEAANTLGNTGLEGAAALLHLKALTGDDEADVLGACYRGLLKLFPERYLSFVGRVLSGKQPGDPEAAPPAPGESRVPEALAVLRGAPDGPGRGRLQESVLLGISLLRSEEAIALLVSQVETAPVEQAAAALSALALHRHDEQLHARVVRIVEARGARRLTQAFAERFDR